jgi:hypothetical protein
MTEDRKPTLQAVALFIFCGVPGMLAFVAGSLVLLRDVPYPASFEIALAAVAGIGMLLALVGVGKLREWRYAFVFITIPVSLALVGRLNPRGVMGLFQIGLAVGIPPFLMLHFVNRYYRRKHRNDGCSLKIFMSNE